MKFIRFKTLKNVEVIINTRNMLLNEIKEVYRVHESPMEDNGSGWEVSKDTYEKIQMMLLELDALYIID